MATTTFRPIYNHDLNVSEEFLASYPIIRDLLKDQRLLTAFARYDADAKRNKRRFQRAGLGSLLFGAIPLLAAATRAATGTVMPFGLIIDACGVVSIALVLVSALQRYRATWCFALFARERIRQWHFQIFIDGHLVGTFVSDRAAFNREFDRRWNDLLQRLQDGAGFMRGFLYSASRDSNFFHEPTPYEDTLLCDAVLEALQTLRITHQLGYCGRKVEPEGGETLKEQTQASEVVASTTLGLAVLVSFMSFAVSLAPTWVHVYASLLGGVGLLLAVLSAASRAYRAGYTLPDELESYDEYCNRVSEIEAVFKNATTYDGKLRQLHHLEEEAAIELRRFLRMKLRASFIF